MMKLTTLFSLAFLLAFLVTAPTASAQQVGTITGTVTDSTAGNALPGVNVIIEGTQQGGATDVNGEYTISDLEAGTYTLRASFVGYTNKVIEGVEVAAGETTVVDFTLSSGSVGLNEVVVVGYGTQEEVNVTGAVGTVTAERFENRPIVSTGRGLQGVTPNLNVTVPSGDPTADVEFNIRGYESINGGSPLILVDGIPMDIERINPQDIKSVTVLKDAASAAVYGARAAFGVILVETKDAKPGKLNVQVNSQSSWDKPVFNMNTVDDSYTYVTEMNKVWMRTYGVPRFDSEYVGAVKAYAQDPENNPEWEVVDGQLRFYGSNNYQDRIMASSSPSQQNQLSISGATENATFYTSFGFLNRDGYLKPEGNDNYKRYNALLKADFEINEWLTLNEEVVFNSERSDKPHFYNWDVNINSLARVPPTMKVQFPKIEGYEQYEGMFFGGTNFLPYLIDGGRNRFSNTDLSLIQGITLSPLDNFNITGRFSYNTFKQNRRDVASKVEIVSANLTQDNVISNGFSSNDFVDIRIDDDQQTVLNLYGDYTLDTRSPHYAKGMIGFNQEWNYISFRQGRANSLITPQVPSIGATVGTQRITGGEAHRSLRGFFYRFNYIYDERYIAEFNGRYDGTSRFPKGDRFGFFPSFSAAWRVSNEGFMTATENWLDNLKIRASYGSLGNQQIGGFYPYVPTMGIGTSNFILSDGRIPTVSPAGLISPSLTWETAVSKNLGLDVVMLDHRLDVSLDAYTRDTKDMLMRKDYPNTLGTGAPQENAADLRTRGWELSATWRDQVNSDLNYSVGVSLADWVSEITRYHNPTGSLSEYYVGQQLGEIWGYETVGIFQSEEEVANAADQTRLGPNWKPGDVQYADLNDDGVIGPGANTLEDHGDLRVIGNSNPRYSLGFNFDVSYKNWSLATFIQGVGKRDYWPPSGNWNWFFPYNAGHMEEYYITESWSKENRDAYFYGPCFQCNKNQVVQTRYLQNSAYARFKSLSISYNLPASLLNTAGLLRAQVYLAAQNLWEYSPIHEPLDPEYIYSNAIDYPLSRTFSAGVNLSF